MKYSSGRINRVFVVRLEDGDVVHSCLEELAQKEDIASAAVIAIGGADQGSVLVTGPENPRGPGPVRPMKTSLDGVCEVVGTGTIFRDEDGAPLVHMHFACGRQDGTITGCIREGVKVWHILELIVLEIEGVKALRKLDPALGIKLLNVEGE